jgi:hypothetical protein
MARPSIPDSASPARNSPASTSQPGGGGGPSKTMGSMRFLI